MDHQIAHHIKKAVAALKNADYPAADKACRAALSIEPDNLYIRNQLALITHLSGDSEKALKIVAGILERDRDFSEALFLKGKILFDNKRFAEARKALERAAKDWPAGDIRVLALLGRTNLQLRRYPEAIESLQKAAAMNPSALAIQNDLGLALKSSRKPEKALEVFKAAVSRDPGRPLLHFNLALTQLDLKNRPGARAAFEKAIALKPDYIEAHEALNEMLGEEHGEFLASYPPAIAKAPDNLELRLKFLDSLLRTGQDERGRKVLEETEKAFGEGPETLARAAKFEITRGAYEKALAHLEKAARLDQPSIPLKLEAAKLLIRLGEYQKALGHLEKGLELSEFHQELIAYQAMCWRLLGDPRHEALNDYEAFVYPALIDVPEGYKSLDQFNDSLLAVLNEFHESEFQPLGQSLRRGSQTLTSLFSLEVREIQQAREAIARKVRAYIDQLPNDKAHPFLKRKTGDFAFSGSWSIQLRDQGYHINHVHPEGWISSSYYVQLPKEIEQGKGNEGCIKFGESPLKLGKREKIGKVVRPQRGMMVVFPSYMFHGTFPFSSQQKRTTMPFDIVPA